MELKDYKKLISKATTKEELLNITYTCLKDKTQTVDNKLYNKVVTLAVQREIELGL